MILRTNCHWFLNEDTYVVKDSCPNMFLAEYVLFPRAKRYQYSYVKQLAGKACPHCGRKVVLVRDPCK